MVAKRTMHVQQKCTSDFQLHHSIFDCNGPVDLQRGGDIDQPSVLKQDRQVRKLHAEDHTQR
jgi:hypothetical protein